MRVRRSLMAVALALLLLLAGCASKRAPPPTFEPGEEFAEEFPEEPVDPVEGSAPPSSQPPTQGSSTSTASPSTTRPADPGPDPEEPPGPESPPRVWASPESARIRPGASLDNGSCTANFLFTSPDNATVYIGTAAHCFKTSSDPRSVPGCQAGTEELGTTMKVEGASAPATLVYSSWVTMQANGEGNQDICRYNDFALLQLADGDAAAVSPAMKEFGGPIGMAVPSSVGSMDKVLTYGNSGLRPEDSPLSPKEGYVTDPPGDGWTLSVYTVSPGVPGDSGSGVLTHDGYALGDLVTLSADGSNGVSVLSLQVEYARQNGFDVRLATWEFLDGGLLP